MLLLLLWGSCTDRSYPSKFGFDGSGGSTTAIVTVLVVSVVVLSLALLALRPGAEQPRKDRYEPVEEPPQHDEVPPPPAMKLEPEFQSPRYEQTTQQQPQEIVVLLACSFLHSCVQEGERKTKSTNMCGGALTIACFRVLLLEKQREEGQAKKGGDDAGGISENRAASDQEPSEATAVHALVLQAAQPLNLHMVCCAQSTDHRGADRDAEHAAHEQRTDPGNRLWSPGAWEEANNWQQRQQWWWWRWWWLSNTREKLLL